MLRLRSFFRVNGLKLIRVCALIKAFEYAFDNVIEIDDNESRPLTDTFRRSAYKFAARVDKTFEINENIVTRAISIINYFAKSYFTLAGIEFPADLDLMEIVKFLV